MQHLVFGNARYGLCGFGLLIVSYALFFFNPVEIIKSAKLKFVEGSYAFQLWQKPPVKVYVNVYIFNVTNADRFMAGEDDKLNVEEVGPYVYWEEIENTNVTFNENDTVTYIPRRNLHFDPEYSIGNPETDRIIAPNIPLLGFSSMLSSSSMFVNLGFNSLVELLDSKPILELTVKDFLWGYDDRLVKMANDLLPTWINFERFGILDRMLDEGTNVITMNVPTKRQKNRAYTIEEFNGSPILHQWDKAEDPLERNKCSLNEAGDGMLFPRHLTTDMSFMIYRKAFCRTFPLSFSTATKNPSGIPVFQYKFLPKVFNSTLDENLCYCPKDGCLTSGLSDISPCYYNIPVAVSFPHFYGGDPSLVENVNGISPDQKKHESGVAVQPDLGIPLDVNIKIQLNLIVKATRYVKRTKKFQGLTLPICWIHLEVKSLPNSLNALLYLCFHVGPPLLRAAIALAASAGFFLVSLTIWRFGRDQTKQQQQQQQQQHEKENGTYGRDAEYGTGCDRDDDPDDDRDAESGGLIVSSGKRQPVSGKRKSAYSAVPLRVVVPNAPSAAIERDNRSSPDFGRGR